MATIPHTVGAHVVLLNESTRRAFPLNSSPFGSRSCEQRPASSLEEKRRPICDSLSPATPARHPGLEAGGTKTKTQSRLPGTGKLACCRGHHCSGAGDMKALGRLFPPPQFLGAAPSAGSGMRASPQGRGPASGSPPGKGPGLRPGLDPAPLPLHPVQTTLPPRPVFSSVTQDHQALRPLATPTLPDLTQWLLTSLG